MKNTLKTLLRSFAVAVACAFPIAQASAQNLGLYTLPPFSAGAVCMTNNSTNVFYIYTLTNGVWNGVAVSNSYGVITGGSTVGSTTQSNLLLLPASAYNNVGTSFGFTPLTGATNAPIGLQVWRSYDYGKSFESSPGFTFTNGPTAAALAAYQASTNLNVPGVTTLGFNFINMATAAGAAEVSNLNFSVNYKADTVQQLQAGIVTGSGTPTPSVTSTNWVP